MILTINECVFLNNYMDKSSEISLFTNLSSELLGTEMTTLTDKNIMKNEKLTSEAISILEIVSKAEKSSKLILNDQNIVVEKYTYKYNNEIVIVENVDGELCFNKLYSFTDINDELAEFLGISVLKNNAVDILLNSDELLVLLALIDIYRQNELLNYAKFDSDDLNLQKEFLISQIKKPNGSSISKIISSQYELKLSDIDKIDLVIESLIEKKYINKDLTLNNELEAFSRSFLIPNLTVLLEQYHINDKGELVILSGFILSAGLRNKLCFIFTSDGIELNSLSSLESLSVIENFLKL